MEEFFKIVAIIFFSLFLLIGIAVYYIFIKFSLKLRKHPVYEKFKGWWMYAIPAWNFTRYILDGSYSELHDTEIYKIARWAKRLFIIGWTMALIAMTVMLLFGVYIIYILIFHTN